MRAVEGQHEAIPATPVSPRHSEKDMTMERFRGTAAHGAQQGRLGFETPSGRHRRALAAVLASTHAPLLALLAHGALFSAAGFAARRPAGSVLAITFGATVLGSAVSLRELRRLDRTMRSLGELSNNDPLTGVFNRRAGEERLAGDLARAARDGRTMLLVALDLDGLKGTNDSLGHAAGDAVIKRAADALRRNLRIGDGVARWGGDEFVLGLWDTADPETATRVLERVSRELRETAEPPPHSSGVAADSPEPPRPSFSAGVVVCEPGDAPDRCLARADELLYQAKRRGRAVVVRETDGQGPFRREPLP